MIYKLNYGQDGKISSIKLNENTSIPLSEGNADYQQFLLWNKAQKTPLDLESTIEPVALEPVRDLAAEVDDIKTALADANIDVVTG